MITYNSPVRVQANRKPKTHDETSGARESATPKPEFTNLGRISATQCGTLAAGELLISEKPHNNVTLRVESAADKKGRAQFTVTWFEKGVMYGQRTAQYYGVVSEHAKFWRERRGCVVKVIELPVKQTKKGKK